MKPRSAIDDAVSSTRSVMRETIQAASLTESENTKKNRAAMDEAMGSANYSRGYMRK
jgi:hypothetical protein